MTNEGSKGVDVNDGPGLDRRGFLMVGGVSVGLLALTAACVNPHEAEQVTQTGTRVPAPSTSLAPFPGSPVLDARLVLTALSVERLAVDTFDTVLKETWLTSAPTIALARKVQDRHRRHADALATRAGAFGQDAAAVKPNPDVKGELVDNELETVREAKTPRERETEAGKLLAMVEDALSQFYAKAGGTFTTPELRRSVGAIGVATARQYTALAGPAGQPLVPLTFEPTAAATIPEDAWLAADESRLPRTAGTTVNRAAQAGR
jgi:hypothetical protein